MARYELTDKQVQNLKALIMDANIKGSAAGVVVELIQCLDHPAVKGEDNDLLREHHDAQKYGEAAP